MSDMELHEAQERIAELERELAAVTVQKDAILSLLGVPDGKAAELARIIAERDRLREALKKAVKRHGFSNDELIAARAALRGEQEVAR